MLQKRSKQRLEHMLRIHGTKAAFKRFNKIFPKHTFLWTSINKGKLKNKKGKEGKTIFKWKGQPNLLSDDLMAKVKTIMIGTHTAGTAISRRIVISIGNGVVKSNNPILLKEKGDRYNWQKIGLEEFWKVDRYGLIWHTITLYHFSS